MSGHLISCLAFVILFIGVTLTADTTTVAPNTTQKTPKEVANETGICRKCICKDNKVNCFDQGIKDFFSLEEWNDLKELKPTTVDLSENHIVNVTLIGDLPIQVLNLSRCSIEFIQTASFRDLQEMTTLDLSHNKLTSDKLSPHAFEGRFAPEEYEPLAAMRKLNLAYNDLHSLHQDLFEHLPELTELDLSGNPLTTIDQVTIIAISSLPMLKVLRMRSCQLTEIPDKFLHTPRYLERLDISDNKLTAVPQELEETKNLVFLNLNQNPIVELDVTSENYPGFPRLRKLQELHMCNMKALRSIGAGSLAGLENLQSLHMSFNPKLSHLDPKAMARPDDIGETYDWPPVRELYLQSNNLSELDTRFLPRWDLLKSIDVSNNPFLCDCSTQWMVDVLVPIIDAKNINSTANMICNEPVEMKGYTMKHLHDIHRTMRCVDKYGHQPEKDGAMLLGTLIGVLLAVPIMLTLMLLWRHGYFAWLGLRGPVDVSRAFYKRAPADDSYNI
ncbi:leucine-rich repeat neuronal protein 3-like [Battus philenor]|uniref:leucine-rich repeat neuronal protein 3-like n=1 Tax=Battus philenor TaxID=42288 RepID=UPI0035CF88A5